MNTACVTPKNSQIDHWMSFPGKRSGSYPRNLTIGVKASDWFNQVFEERLDDKYLKRFLRVAKMDEDAAQERLRRMFALQKGTEFRFPFSQKFELLLFLWTYLVLPFLRIFKGFLVTTCKIPYKNGMKCSVISRLHQSKE